MLINHQDNQEPTIHWMEIVLLFWRGRWITVGCGILGVLAALCLIKFSSVYESHAKLLVRYVRESSVVDSVERSVSDVGADTQTNDGSSLILNNEIEILTSTDLVKKVALEIGFDKLLPKEKRPIRVDEAVRSVQNALIVYPIEHSSVISLSYQHSDKEVARQVLESLLEQYLKKHLEVHRPAGVGYIRTQAEESQNRLQKIEQEIQLVMEQAGVLSTEVSLNLVEQQRATLRTQFATLEAELAASEARLYAIAPNLSPQEFDSELEEGTPPEEVIRLYQTLLDRSANLRNRNLELSNKFTPNSPLVVRNNGLIKAAEDQRLGLASQYPSLVSKTNLTRQEQVTKNRDLSIQVANISSLKARKQVMERQLEKFEEKAIGLPFHMSRLKSLTARKDDEEKNHSFLRTSLQKAVANAALDASKVPNLSIVQEPLPPSEALPSTVQSLIMVLLAGSIAIGLVLTFIIERFIDRRIKRPEELETLYGIPLGMTIPFISKKHLKQGAPGLDCYSRDIIDVIIDGDDSRRRNKMGPKLLGVTGVGQKVGVTTITNQLAASLRSQGEKVLVLTFNEGEEGQDLDFNFIKTLQNNVAGDYALNESLLEAKRFKLMPGVLSNFDYDYVVFDMPLTGPGIPTQSICRLFNKVLMVVSPDHTDRDVLVGVHSELVSAEADVSCVFNKAKVKPRRTSSKVRTKETPLDKRLISSSETVY